MHPRIEAVRINGNTLLLNDNNEATFYLVTGTERALLIDTANGIVDVAELCRELTPLPVTVVNTHGHCDHVYGNLYVKEAYLHPADISLHNQHFAFAEMAAIRRETGLNPAKLWPLNIGQKFDLGSLTLEVVDLRGHTPGSIGLLEAKNRVLFSGDGVNSHLWMQLPESLPIATLKNTLTMLLMMYGDQFDFLLTGHGKGRESKSIINLLIQACDRLLRGERTLDRPYRYFGGECLAHPLDSNPNRCIVFDEIKL